VAGNDEPDGSVSASPVEVARNPGPAASRAVIEATLVAEGLVPHAWGNGAGVTYGRHAHGFHKVLVCVSGSIVFHTDAGDVELGPGDRMELPPGVEHAATVGAGGVECVEAPRR
jgi:mannose-6-phosphate isomerase-like protein (cupin superfamily)